MDIKKIQELALANGFSLKEQASGNMDLHSYVYEFAQAIAMEALNQARLIFGQDAVTINDTEMLDSEISSISSEFEAEHFFDNDDADRLEILVAKSMRLGELYERQKWQAAKAQAVPEGFALVESSELEQLKLDSEYFEKSCVEWTNRAYEQRAKVDHIKNEVERFKQSGTSLDLEYFLESLIELSTFKRDAELFKVWQETKAVPEGFVLVEKSHLSNVVEKIHLIFEKDPTLTLGELLPIQQKLEAMIEAQEQGHD